MPTKKGTGSERDVFAFMENWTLEDAPPIENKVEDKALPLLRPATHSQAWLGFPLSERFDANINEWILKAPETNPALLQMFRDRDLTPARDLVPWAGEFAGKFLLSAVPHLRISPDPEQRWPIYDFVEDLLETQADDGYFGPFPADRRMTGEGLWDLWGQYHVMLGLLRWNETTGHERSLEAALRCADMMCRRFLDGAERVRDAGSEEMNQALIHVLLLLYRRTGVDRYLRLAHEIEADWEALPSGDYVRTALAGVPFHRSPKPRWESLHDIQGIAELYFLTGDAKYRKAFTAIWRSIRDGDRHNTGGFSSGEQATGNPYDPRAIETCCTVAWMALTVDYLRMTADPTAADELELSTWNGLLGSQHTSGRWWTYNTPMDGERRSSAHDIVFQARAGSPELNCCSVNGPRGLGIATEWALMESNEGITLNYLGDGFLAARLPTGEEVVLRIDGNYPVAPDMSITLDRPVDRPFILDVRIPAWSKVTKAWMNDAPLPDPTTGAYYRVDRKWAPYDRFKIEFDFTPRVWIGERECEGRASFYLGPILLAHDPRFTRTSEISPMSVDSLVFTPVFASSYTASWPRGDGPAPLLLVRKKEPDGSGTLLCDFASAGAMGNSYRTWLPIK